MLKRLNKACRFFPCHRGLEDCTFCYCPFYPCRDGKRGSLVYSDKYKQGIWSCEACSWIHKRKVTDSIFALIRKNKARIKEEDSRKQPQLGIIVLGHGSKLKNANLNLEAAVKAIRKKRGLNLITSAYLQLSQPSLEKSVNGLIAKGCREVIIIPFFLFSGNHVERDIPRIIEEEKARHPRVNFIYARNLGEDARIADIVLDRVEEASQGGNNY